MKLKKTKDKKAGNYGDYERRNQSFRIDPDGEIEAKYLPPIKISLPKKEKK